MSTEFGGRIHRNGASNYSMLAQRFEYHRQTIRKSAASLYVTATQTPSIRVRRSAHDLAGDTVHARFLMLAATWRRETSHLSSIAQRAMHPCYQRIIGMGREVIPHILADLAATQDQWFWALAAISGENPVPPEDRGNVAGMTIAWLKWAKNEGYEVVERSRGDLP